MNYIVEFSGGIESTAAAWKVLTSFHGASLLLMHAQIRISEDPNPVWPVQLSCSLSIVEKLRMMFPQSYVDIISPVLEMPGIPGSRMRDLHYYRYLSSILACNPLFPTRYIVKGVNSSDCDHLGVNLPEFGETNTDHKGLEDDEIMRAIFTIKGNTETKIWRPLVNLSKESCWAMIPPHIKPLVWSCTNPVINGKTATPCGKCSKCKELEKHGIKESTVNIEKGLEMLNKYKSYPDLGL